MKVPSFIAAQFKQEHSLAGFVETILGRIENHMTANGMEFFPEYTDHHISHIQAVMETAVGLISQDVLDRMLLGPKDAASLAISIALHDFGMFMEVHLNWIDGLRIRKLKFLALLLCGCSHPTYSILTKWSRKLCC